MKLPKEIREKKDLGGSVSKNKTCSVKECNEIAVRSLSEGKWGNILEKAKLNVEENKSHKVFLCKKHYKEANKIRQKDEKLIQKKGFLDDRGKGRQGKWYDAS